MRNHVTTLAFDRKPQIARNNREGPKQRSLRVAQKCWIAWLLVMVAGIAGCAQTEQAREVETSGFLRDYSILQPGKEGEALLVYKNPQADFSMYQAVYVEPAIFLITKKSTVPQEDLGQTGGTICAQK